MNVPRMVLLLLAFTAFTTLANASPTTAPGAPELLGPEFRSPTNGIAFRPPANCIRLPAPPAGLIAQFSDDDQHWVFKVSRLSLPQPTPLNDFKDQFGQLHEGLLNQTASQIRQDSAMQVVAQNVVQIGPAGKTPVGILVVRFHQNSLSRLVQHALVQANDQFYYVLELTTPARSGADNTGDDPTERLAADTFNQVIDSLHLLDRGEIYRDQSDRLIRSRGLLANWSPTFLTSRLIHEQFFRLLRDGKDIGYSYELEELDDKSGKIGNRPVIRISVRSDSAPEAGAVVASQSRLIMTVDRKHEDWVRITILSLPDPKATADAPKNASQITEVGVSDQHSKTEPLNPNGNGLNAVIPPGSAPPDDAGQLALRLVETWQLSVSRNVIDVAHPMERRDLPEFKQDLPPFYLSQVLSHLLPRLLVDREPKGYLFATYVPNGNNGQPAVMLRYLDVLPAAPVTLDGKSIIAVRVNDRIGIEGPVTTHYLDPDDGSYLGSAATTLDKDGVSTTDMVLPSDAATLRKLWPNCKLTPPDKIVDGGKSP